MTDKEMLLNTFKKAVPTEVFMTGSDYIYLTKNAWDTDGPSSSVIFYFDETGELTKVAY